MRKDRVGNRLPGFRYYAASLLAVLTLSTAACMSEDTEADGMTSFHPTATIQDLMLSLVDPSADAIWESVATIVTHDGMEERRPRTDEDWKQVHAETVRLVEATNLLLMRGREVAHPSFRSENPGIELEPEEIQALIDEDHETWDRLVRDMYRVAHTMLVAAERRDADTIFNEGGSLDTTCERCHQHYWYPGELERQRNTVGPALAAPATDVPSRPATGGTGGPTGTIEGHVLLQGTLPGNPLIRMGVDPLCAALTDGKQIVQETVVTSRDGGLANTFVQLQGSFPEVPVPGEPVVIEQQDCVFTPRVVGVRAGQLLQIRNHDPLLHNLNSVTTTTNRFNVAQPMQGMVYELRPEEETEMLQIRCDLHRWMTEYIGVVAHPYFATTDLGGSFAIADVPPGTYSVRAWHEKYGVLTQSVTVEPDRVSSVDFNYAGG